MASQNRRSRPERSPLHPDMQTRKRGTLAGQDEADDATAAPNPGCFAFSQTCRQDGDEGGGAVRGAGGGSAGGAVVEGIAQEPLGETPPFMASRRWVVRAVCTFVLA
jgi:hypothetical protein